MIEHSMVQALMCMGLRRESAGIQVCERIPTRQQAGMHGAKQILLHFHGYTPKPDC